MCKLQHSCIRDGVAILFAGAIVTVLLIWELKREQSVCSSRGLESDSRFLGTKTPYSFLRQIRAGEERGPAAEERRPGCQIIKMYAVVRHGARYATAKRAVETGKLKATLISRLGLPFSGEESSTAPEMSGDLSEQGMIEQYCLAARLKSKLPELLQQPYSKQYYNLKSSQTSRTVKSALSFAAGLFGGQGPLDGYQPVDVESEPLENDRLLRFDEHSCPLYDKLIARNKSFVKDRLSSPSVLAVRDHLQTILNPGGELFQLSMDDVWGVYKLCVDDSVLLGRESDWCQLFSPSHLRTLHQISNIKAFWRKGGGFPITGLRSVHLVKDLLEFMANSSGMKVALRFGHSETLLPLLSFLEVPSSGLIDFDASILSPFSANALFYLYNCSSNSGHTDMFLGLELNESPLEMGLCPWHARGEGHHLCPLHHLAEAAAEKSQQWRSHSQLCALPQH